MDGFGVEVTLPSGDLMSFENGEAVQDPTAIGQAVVEAGPRGLCGRELRARRSNRGR